MTDLYVVASNFPAVKVQRSAGIAQTSSAVCVCVKSGNVEPEGCRRAGSLSRFFRASGLLVWHIRSGRRPDGECFASYRRPGLKSSAITVRWAVAGRRAFHSRSLTLPNC